MEGSQVLTFESPALTEEGSRNLVEVGACGTHEDAVCNQRERC